MFVLSVHRAYRDGTGKNRTLWEANRPLVSPLLFFTMTSIWVLCSPTNILERDPRCFTFFVGIIFSNICCQLIVAQMSSTRCELVSWLLAPVAIVVVTALALPSSLQLELPLLYGLTVFAFLAHVHYGVCLVSCLVTHLLFLLIFFFSFNLVIVRRSGKCAVTSTFSASG